MERLIACMKESLLRYDKALVNPAFDKARIVLCQLRSRRARQLSDLERALFVLGSRRELESGSLRGLRLAPGRDAWLECRILEDRIASELHDLIMLPDLYPGLRSLLSSILLQVRVSREDLDHHRRIESLRAA